MKTKIIILFLMLYHLLTASAFAQTVTVTNVSDCKPDLYIVQYLIDSEVVDVKKVAIQ